MTCEEGPPLATVTINESIIDSTEVITYTCPFCDEENTVKIAVPVYPQEGVECPSCTEVASANQYHHFTVMKYVIPGGTGTPKPREEAMQAARAYATTTHDPSRKHAILNRQQTTAEEAEAELERQHRLMQTVRGIAQTEGSRTVGGMPPTLERVGSLQNLHLSIGLGMLNLGGIVSTFTPYVPVQYQTVFRVVLVGFFVFLAASVAYDWVRVRQALDEYGYSDVSVSELWVDAPVMIPPAHIRAVKQVFGIGTPPEEAVTKP